MSNQYLKLRRSAIPGKIPTTSSLDLGEIALNTYDGLAFMKKSGSSGEEIVTINNGGGSNIDTGSFVTTGSNIFNGNQTITGSVDITDNLTINNTINTSFIDGSNFGSFGLYWGSGSYIGQINFTTNTNISHYNSDTGFQNILSIYGDKTISDKPIEAPSFTGSFTGSLDSTGVIVTGSVNITGSLTLNGAEVKPYKVYTALLNQSGDGTSTQTIGSLSIGTRYAITTYVSGDDFSNVAEVVSGVINTTGCEFIATGTTPNDYSNGSTLTDTSAPIATIFENNIGDIVWAYAGVGNYQGILAGAFPSGKRWSMAVGDAFIGDFVQIGFNDDSTIQIWNYDLLSPGGPLTDGTAMYIEIRVYP